LAQAILTQDSSQHFLPPPFALHCHVPLPRSVDCDGLLLEAGLQAVLDDGAGVGQRAAVHFGVAPVRGHLVGGRRGGAL